MEAELPPIGSRRAWFVLGTCALSPAVVGQLVATRPDLGPAAELRQDPDEDVRMRARLQPSIRTWAEFEAVRSVVDHGRDCTCPITEPADELSPDWYATCAASEEPVLRRVAASWPGLPEPPLEDPADAIRRAAPANPT
ncbi:hypothetical protein [Streptomyces sp. NPDC001502]|uniref:hypothetical protein n=1 Tax=Streptomyces sp. NPDC001502 TaxID=3364578 RepID=UPI0036D0CAD2